MKTAHEILSTNHWTLESFTQRMTVGEWKQVLKEEADSPIVKGCLRRLIAKKLGFGYVDVSKAPLDIDDDGRMEKANDFFENAQARSNLRHT